MAIAMPNTIGTDRTRRLGKYLTHSGRAQLDAVAGHPGGGRGGHP